MDSSWVHWGLLKTSRLYKFSKSEYLGVYWLSATAAVGNREVRRGGAGGKSLGVSHY